MEEIGTYENPFGKEPERCPSCRGIDLRDRDDGTSPVRWLWCTDCGLDIAVSRDKED